MSKTSNNSFQSYSKLEVNGKSYGFYDLKSDKVAKLADISQLPNSIKVLLENLLRNEDGVACSVEDIEAVAKSAEEKSSQEISPSCPSSARANLMERTFF